MSKLRSYIYILTNRDNKVLYIGVTADLAKQVYEHRHKLVDGFTKTYNVTKPVYYEIFDSIKEAVTREKQIKGWLRKKKCDLISAMNPGWRDLYDEIA